MSEEEFEAAYDLLATAIDRSGEQECAFLTRLSLLLLNDCRDLSHAQAMLEAAANDFGNAAQMHRGNPAE